MVYIGEKSEKLAEGWYVGEILSASNNTLSRLLLIRITSYRRLPDQG